MRIGKLFMFGFSGLEPTKAILDFIKDDGLGGVILFKRNIKSAEQLKSLTGALQDAANGNLLIGIDQEGGKVSNLPSSIIDVPPMEEVGRGYKNGEGLSRAHKLGHEFGDRLLELGINIDFAPVLDVRSNQNNPIINTRSFSEDPEIVARLGSEVFRGMGQSGLISCGKHFPGHGDTIEDSHKTLPHLKHNLERLYEIELVPFKRAIEKKIPTLMSAHVVYEGVDSKNPATLSKKILTDILRDELGFEGVLFSDDLEMDAISTNYDLGEASVAAINAGCDILLVCHQEARQKTVMEAVKKAVAEGSIKKERIQASLTRIRTLTK